MVHVSVPQLIHDVVFRQGPRSIVLRLTDRSGFWDTSSNYEGSWRQGSSDPDGIKLYRRFSAAEKSNLVWKYTAPEALVPRPKGDKDAPADIHFGTIDVGINEVNATRQGRASEWTFKPWLRLEGAKKYADRRFYIAGTGKAQFKLHGSSDTFDPKAGGEWWVSQVHVGARSFTERDE